MHDVGRFRIAVLMMLVLIAVAPLSAGTLYSQPFSGAASLFASQNDTGGGNGQFAVVYDNFTLAASGSITGINWTGGYFSGAPSTITGWTIQLWSDSAGQPGSSLYSQTVSGTGGEVFLGNYDGSPVFTYSVDLSSAFNAAPATQYWLSLVPDLAFPPQWGWATATGGDGVVYQDFFGARSPLQTDFAFDLNSGGNPIPEPISFVLVGSALALLAVRRRKSA
jgi:hypothetical protein